MRSFITTLVLAVFAFALPAIADESNCSVVFTAQVNPTEAQVTDDFINFQDDSIDANATAGDETIVPVTFSRGAVAADVDVAPGAGDIWRISIFDDGVTTGLSCDISGTGTSCNSGDGIAKFSAASAIAVGSDIHAVIDSGEGAGAPAAAAAMRVAICLAR